MRISAGNLDRRVALLRPVPGKDADGGPVTTYEEAGKRWCQRLRFSARVVDREPHRQPTPGLQLLLRLDSLTKTLTTEWRIAFGGVEMRITGLDDNPADGSLVIDGEAAQP